LGGNFVYRKNMTIIISIETATEVCSVALHNGSELLGLCEVDQERSHSKALAGMIKQIVSESGLSLRDLGAVAISQGPGSYTGLRIGTASAKGLCFALDIPLIAVSTLKGMAQGVTSLQKHSTWLCPMIDARRMEVYCWLSDSDLIEIQAEQAKVISVNSFEKELNEHPILFFGSGMAKSQDLLGKNSNAVFVEGVKPSARFIGELAGHKFLTSDFVDLAYFKPRYLKEFHTTQPKTRII